MSDASLHRYNHLDISTKFCPICKNKNDSQAIVCVHCGAALDTYFVDPGATRTTDMPTQGPETIADLRINEIAIPPGEIAFFAQGTSKPVFSCADNEFILGRQKSEASEAFLDLSALG